MSDKVEVDGRKYYEESYLVLANANAKRCKVRIAELKAQIATLREKADALDALEEWLAGGDRWISEMHKLALSEKWVVALSAVDSPKDDWRVERSTLAAAIQAAVAAAKESK